MAELVVHVLCDAGPFADPGPVDAELLLPLQMLGALPAGQFELAALVPV